MEPLQKISAIPAFYQINAKTFGAAYNETLESYCAVGNTNFTNRTFVDFESNHSVRSEFNRGDYDYFRPNEAGPRTPEETIYWCMEAYKKIGIVNSVINLMGDFTVQGIKFVHPNRKIQKFYNTLAEKWRVPHVSERFANTLYRCGTVVIHGLEGKISLQTKNKWSKTSAKNDIKLEEPKIKDKVIPLRYIIYNPLSLEILNKGILGFSDRPIFGLKINGSILKDINNGLADENRSQYYRAEIPADFLEAIQSKAKVIPLDVNKVSAYYYKKDDWDLWGSPIAGPILDDLMRLEKLNLADMAALDGAISQVRHWKIGSLEYKIAPSATAINKMRSVLAKSVGGGVRELVTGPEIDFKESSTTVHQFLGSEKYQATLNAIYAGLGIPPTLTGVSTASGFTNNYISIKTLVERLEYGRTKLIEFWQAQLNKVALAMGFSSPAKIVFDQMVLSDESAEKALLLQLVDRDIISYESIRGRFDLDDEIERLRVKREYSERLADKDGPQKSGPFHNPEKIHEYFKLLLSGGDVTPSELGLELQPRKAGEKSRMDKQVELKKFSPPKPNGRPTNVKDSQKRKKKVVKPRTSAELYLWAGAAYQKVAEQTTHFFLGMLGKKNQRMLTVSQAAELEQIKIDIFANLTPFTTVDENTVYNILSQQCKTDVDFNSIFIDLTQKFVAANTRKPTVDELRNIVVASYVESKSS